MSAKKKQKHINTSHAKHSTRDAGIDIDIIETADSKDQQSLLDHLAELRKRILFSMMFFVPAFILSYKFSDHILSILLEPLLGAGIIEIGVNNVIYTQMTEAFSTYITISLLGAFIVSFPAFAYNMWKFIAPGLYKDERSWVVAIMIACPTLFFIGGTFAYKFIIPLAWNFFANFQSEQLVLVPKVSEYVSLITQFIIAFGLSFQLPIVLVIMGKLGVISIETLKKNRKIAFIAIMIVSAFLTPPDVLSMLGLTFPIYALYEISILVLNLLIKSNKKK